MNKKLRRSQTIKILVLSVLVSPSVLAGEKAYISRRFVAYPDALEEGHAGPTVTLSSRHYFTDFVVGPVRYKSFPKLKIKGDLDSWRVVYRHPGNGWVYKQDGKRLVTVGSAVPVARFRIRDDIVEIQLLYGSFFLFHRGGMQVFELFKDEENIKTLLDKNRELLSLERKHNEIFHAVLLLILNPGDVIDNGLMLGDEKLRPSAVDRVFRPQPRFFSDDLFYICSALSKYSFLHGTASVVSCDTASKACRSIRNAELELLRPILNSSGDEIDAGYLPKLETPLFKTSVMLSDLFSDKIKFATLGIIESPDFDRKKLAQVVGDYLSWKVKLMSAIDIFLGKNLPSSTIGSTANFKFKPSSKSQRSRRQHTTFFRNHKQTHEFRAKLREDLGLEAYDSNYESSLDLY